MQECAIHDGFYFYVPLSPQRVSLNYVFELLPFLSCREAYNLSAFSLNFYNFTLPNLYRKIWHLLYFTVCYQ